MNRWAKKLTIEGRFAMWSMPVYRYYSLRDSLWLLVSIEAARDYRGPEITAQSRVSILMKRLRRQIERQSESEEQLRALLRSITKSPRGPM
jgi:hypothetical protein